jgi:magnesium transporter
MFRTIFESASPPFVWIDVVEPSRSDLERIAREYGYPETAVSDCLDPEHLPKFERFGPNNFAILRAYDEHADLMAETIQSLTRKVALFWGPAFLVSIHRKEQVYLTEVMTAWRERQANGPGGSGNGSGFTIELLAEIALAVVLSYEQPLEGAEARMDAFEGTLLLHTEVSALLHQMYMIKRRVALLKRLLWHTISVSHRFSTAQDKGLPLLQDLRENAESMHFYADELLEDVNNLLHMQLSLAAHRTNEVVQILTVFSAFFLPLTFIVGVYGMNFQHMPELPHRWGYPMVWVLMISVSAAIWLWFRRRGWLK